MRLRGQSRFICLNQYHKMTLLILILLSFFLQKELGFAQGRPPANVVVSPVVRDDIQNQITQIGTAESWRASRVAAETGGRVEALLVRRGAKVKKGDLLARLSASGLLLKLQQNRAKQNAAIARLKKAKDNLKRFEGLIKDGLISEKAYQDALLTVGELMETLGANEAERLQTQDTLKKKRVLAPFGGIITQELTEEGEWVAVGGGIVQLIDLSQVRVLVEMPGKYVRDVRVGETVSIKIDAIPDRKFSGRVHALIPAGDREARLFPVEVHVRNEDLLINEGMLARVVFDLGRPRSVLLVDKDAVIRRRSSTFVFVVREGKAIKETVTTGQAKTGLIEVSGSINEGDLVVIRGNERLREGLPVNMVPGTPSTLPSIVQPSENHKQP